MSHAAPGFFGGRPVGRRGFLLSLAAGWAATTRRAPAALPPAPAAKLLWTIPDAGLVLGHSPDGASLFTWKTEQGVPRLIVWNLTTGKRVRAHRLPVGETEPGKQFPYNLTGGRYYVCEHKEKLLAIDLKTGEEWRHDMTAHADARGLYLSPTGEYTARFNGYYVVHLIETRTGKFVHQPSDENRQDGKTVGGEFTPDGRYFVYQYREGGNQFLKVWDVAAWKVIGTMSVPSPGALLSPGGTFLLAPTPVPGGGPPPFDPKPGDRAPGQFTVWSLPDLRERCVIPWQTAGHPGTPLYPFSFSPDGRRVATWPGGDGLQLWDLSAAKKVGTVGIDPFLPALPAADHFTPPVFWSPDGTKVVAYSRDEPILRVIDAARPREFWFRESEAELAWPHFTSDSRRLAISTGDGIAYLDAGTGTDKLAVPAFDHAEGLHLTPDGRFLWFADVRRVDPVGDVGWVAPPEITWRVLHRDTGREVLRAKAKVCEHGFPLHSRFHAPGDGRTLLQIENMDRRPSWNLLCWEVEGA